MKSQTRIRVVLGLSILIVGISLFAYAIRIQRSTQVFPATVNRDCAPWDGAAFTVRIALSGGDIIDISIWQSPEIKFPVTFSFPDNTGQVGNAILNHPVGLPEPMSGTVFFWRVDRENPVEGKFDFVTETGERFEGQFKAEWENQTMMCG